MSDDDKIGYANPPQSTRWQKGQSGNPKVRPKTKSKMLKDAAKSLTQPVDTRGPSGDTIQLYAIVAAYRQDFSKYAKRHQIKYVDLVFNEVPALAGKKFKYNALQGTWKARELAPALDLLCKAAVVHRVTHASGNGIPLGAESNPRRFKTLFLDIGLAQRIMGADVRPWLLNPEAHIVNAGGVTESFVGQELLAYSRPQAKGELYYWHREARSSNAEVDYLLPIDNAVIPVEVKSGATGRLRSLRSFLEEKGDRTPYGIRFCGQPFSVHADLHSYPVYALPHVLRRQIPRDWIT